MESRKGSAEVQEKLARAAMWDAVTDLLRLGVLALKQEMERKIRGAR